MASRYKYWGNAVSSENTTHYWKFVLEYSAPGRCWRLLKFSIDSAYVLDISHVASTIFASRFYILDSDGYFIDASNWYDPNYAWELPSMQYPLDAGTYYIVSEGSDYGPFGDITTSISVYVQRGKNMSVPIEVGVLDPEQPYSDSQSLDPVNDFGNNIGNMGDDIFYKFKVPYHSDVAISTCNSNFDTYLMLLDSVGNIIEDNDNHGPICSDERASLRVKLYPGTYYAVVESAAPTFEDWGDVSLRIAIDDRDGTNMSKPIYVGVVDVDTPPYSHTVHNALDIGYGDNVGEPGDDIYYKFMVSHRGMLTLSHCASEIETNMYLLDSLGNMIADNTGQDPFCPNYRASIRQIVEPGIYYVVSEGAAGFMGYITTQITMGPIPRFERDKNYILKYMPSIETSDEAALNILAANKDKVKIEIDYFDGFGRPMQTIQWQTSPMGKDIVQHIEYDSIGREFRKYLPYASDGIANGNYKIAVLTDVHDFYNNPSITEIVRTPYPYAETVFENSSLNRVEQQGTPGADWQPYNSAVDNSGHTVKLDYGTNRTDEVRLWHVTSTGADGTQYYLPGTLYKTVVKNENWTDTTGRAGTVEEYKNFENKIVLKRVWKDETGSLDTYYVYDYFGRLLYVIPPGYTTATLTDGNNIFNEFIYAYRYDARRRVVEKKLPGKGWEWIVYNKNDQPVLVQDSVQRAKPLPEWRYMKYDVLGRVTETGLFRKALSRSALQDTLDAEEVNASIALWETRSHNAVSYDNRSYPRASSTKAVLTVNYYDDYGFKTSNVFAASAGLDSTAKVKGLLTGIEVSKDDGTVPLLTANYYNDKRRLTQFVSQNHLGGTDYVTNTYGFVGELLTSRRVHKVNGDSTAIFTKNKYDHVGRLLSVRHSINDQDTVILSKNEYNEIGQLIRKLIGGNHEGTVFHDTVSYAYNERGWVIGANATHFSYGLRYNAPTEGATAQYNGNISEQHWTQHRQPAKYFTYNYDKLNRLTDGNSVNGDMREQLEYDDMGNITNLKRDNHTTGTTYSYTGNRLKSLSGAITTAQDYGYDGNGNATTDRTGMTFTYNHLNLPDSAWNSTVHVGYLYDALGTKLRKHSSQGGNRDYVGGIEYSGSNIELIHTGEGVAYNNGGVFKYRYNLTDHLGNVRTTLTYNPATETVDVLQQDDYYPFGKQYQRFLSGIENKYLYNGKEKQDELGGGNQYDYGARLYDAEIGRWNVVDPLAEMHHNLTGYNYVLNNPINFIDPWGLDTVNANNLKDEWGNFNPDKDIVEMDPIDIPPPNNGGWSSYDIWPYDGSEGDGKDPVEGLGLRPLMPPPVTKSSSTGPFRELSQENEGSKDIWNSPLMRAIVPDKINISIGGDFTQLIGGFGIEPFAFTILTRGKPGVPGLYMTPMFNLYAGGGTSFSGSVNLGLSWYTGDPRNISADMLTGHTFGAMATGGYIGSASVGGSYSPVTNTTGFINVNGGIGIGYGAFVGGQYQYTPGYGKLW